MAVLSRPLTLEQFLARPEEEPPLECADGVVTHKVSPKGQHSALQAELIKRFDQSGLPTKLARAFPELRATFAGASRVPDVAVYRWERIPRDATGRIANDFLDAPDITVEIVSPEHYRGSERSSGDPLGINGLVRRCLWYVAHGVQVALLVDPADESVLAFRPDGRVSALHGGDGIDLSEVLRGFELTVEQLFASLR